MPAESVADRLLSLVSSASEADVAELDRAIGEKEKDLATLKRLRSVLVPATPTPTPTSVARQPRTPKPAAGAPAEAAAPLTAASMTVTDQRRLKAARYILKNGSTPGAALCRLFDIPLGSQGTTFDHAWFDKTDAGLELTPIGRSAARGDGPGD